MPSDRLAERKHRIDALKKNVEWLEEHDLDEHRMEAAQRLGLIKGDVAAILRQLDQ